MDISTPYDPVHLTHVGFNADTGEYSVRLAVNSVFGQSMTDRTVQGLPKQWQQMLSDSGITDQEQASHPQAVVDIVAFYQVRFCLRHARNAQTDSCLRMPLNTTAQDQAQQTIRSGKSSAVKSKNAGHLLDLHLRHPAVVGHLLMTQAVLGHLQAHHLTDRGYKHLRFRLKSLRLYRRRRSYLAHRAILHKNQLEAVRVLHLLLCNRLDRLHRRLLLMFLHQRMMLLSRYRENQRPR